MPVATVDDAENQSALSKRRFASSPSPPLPRWPRVGERPEAQLGGPRLGLEDPELVVIRGITPVPPREPGAHELPVEAPAVREDHLGYQSPVPVPAVLDEGDGLPESEFRGELLCPFPEGLPALRAVDAVEADSDLLPVDEDLQGVAVHYPHYQPLEGGREGK